MCCHGFIEQPLLICLGFKTHILFLIFGTESTLLKLASGTHFLVPHLKLTSWYGVHCHLRLRRNSDGGIAMVVWARWSLLIEQETASWQCPLTRVIIMSVPAWFHFWVQVWRHIAFTTMQGRHADHSLLLWMEATQRKIWHMQQQEVIRYLVCFEPRGVNDTLLSV